MAKIQTLDNIIVVITTAIPLNIFLQSQSQSQSQSQLLNIFLQIGFLQSQLQQGEELLLLLFKIFKSFKK